MYQAIVFLPLLGAILAGFITLVGAHARFPGGPPAADGHAAGPAHAAQAHDPVHEAGGAVHHSHGEPPSPRRSGSRSAELITTTLLFIAMVLSWIALWRVGFGHHDSRDTVLPFIVSGDLKVDWAMRVDTLTAVMLVVVTTVSALVHLYSIGYMAEDPYRPRFFAYLSLFTFAMLMLVTSDNLVQMFFGWEGVGLACYLLIGFWYQKPAANAAAIKAFVVNRVGDFGFALGIFAVFMMTGAVDFDTIFAQAPALTGKTIPLLPGTSTRRRLICLLLFMGAMGKSAQFLLHTWLPDAMEGPTPVSALIHAATMVTAGVFMVARLSPLFELRRHGAGRSSPSSAAPPRSSPRPSALVQNDIKRIIAYSTCSQLGYMFVAMGVGGLFGRHVPPVHPRLLQGAAVPGLGLGDHAMHHEQDMREDGRAAHQDPVHLRDDGGRHPRAHRHSPLTAGYFSKDAIIEAAYAGTRSGGLLRLPDDADRGGAHLVLLVASHSQDLPRPAARSPSISRRRMRARGRC